ncbi:hypothetical protein [Streptacidiphilus sp. PAMC 29251]
MAGGKRAEDRLAGAVGPIETPSEAGRADRLGPLPDLVSSVSETDGLAVERRLERWWHGLNPRRRRLGGLTAGALALGLIATAVTVAIGHSDGNSAAPLPPWPIEAVKVTYDGLMQDGGGPVGFTVLLTVANSTGAILTVSGVAQPYRGVSAASVLPLPLRVRQGAPQLLRVRMAVKDCSQTPRADDLPFIDVTLSNARAIQTQSEILGGSYASDLHAAILDVCPAVPPPPRNPLPRNFPRWP